MRLSWSVLVVVSSMPCLPSVHDDVPGRPGRSVARESYSPLNRIAADPARVGKADGSCSGRVMAALSHAAAVIDVTAADQSCVKAGCRTRGNHVKMPAGKCWVAEVRRDVPLPGQLSGAGRGRG